MLCGLNAKVIVLDGTGDISPEYDQDYIHEVDCSEKKRKLPNLHIRLVNESTSRQNVSEKLSLNSCYVKTIASYVYQQTRINKQCIFTYKDINKLLREEIDEEDKREVEEETDRPHASDNGVGETPTHTVTEIDMILGPKAYLGNLKGLNDFTDYYAFAQIGLNRKPDTYYMAHLFEKNPDWTERLLNQASLDLEKHALLLDKTRKTKTFRNELNADLLADTEQNIFRAPIRSPECNNDVYYFLFFDHNTYSDLIEMIQKRFGKDGYGADVQCIENPVELREMRASQRVHTDRSKFQDQACKDYVLGLPEGTRFTLDDIANATGLSTEQVRKTKERSKERSEGFNELLEYMITDQRRNKRVVYCKKTPPKSQSKDA